MNILPFHTISDSIVLYEKENGREIRIYKLLDCMASGIQLYYPNTLLYSNKQLILPILERTMSLKSGTVYEKMGMKFDCGIMDYNNEVCETPVFFFIYNTDNYFHYLYDTLPYLISYFHLKKSVPELKLLMQYPNDQRNQFYPFVLEFLELLQICREDIVLVDKSTFYKEVYISTSYTHDIDSNLPPRKEIYDFYRSISARVLSTYSLNTPPKIYVSRRTWMHGDFSNIGTNYTTRRKMVNEDDLVDKLVADGFQEVFTEKLSTIEKIAYFAGATHVIGAIGGGISNVVFSPATTHLEAIVSPGFLDVNTRFKYSLDCVDVYYNHNTQHVEEGRFKKYMRVKFEGGVGEIEEIYSESDTLVLSYTDGSNTGWNSECVFKRVEINMDQVEPLDNGLNSMWKIIIS